MLTAAAASSTTGRRSTGSVLPKNRCAGSPLAAGAIDSLPPTLSLPISPCLPSAHRAKCLRSSMAQIVALSSTLSLQLQATAPGCVRLARREGGAGEGIRYGRSLCRLLSEQWRPTRNVSESEVTRTMHHTKEAMFREDLITRETLCKSEPILAA